MGRKLLLDKAHIENIRYYNVYRANGGYAAAEKVLKGMSPEQVVEEVKQHLPDKVFKTVIPRTVRLSEAPSFGKTIFAYDSANPGSTAYRNLAKEVIERFGLKS